MITTLSGASSPATLCNMPGTPVRTVAERLTERGLTVNSTTEEDGRLLKVARTNNVRCEIIVDDSHLVMCEYVVCPRDSARPGRLTHIAARMLGADYPSPGQYTELRRGVTLAGAVGHDMRTRGLTVTMCVIQDDDDFRVSADVVIANPAKPERGTVTVGDDGWVYWECADDELPGGATDLADTIADVLTFSTHVTVRDRLAVVYGACLRAITCGHAHAADVDKDNRGHHA